MVSKKTALLINAIQMSCEEMETGNSFVRAITDETARDLEIDFGFLSQGVSYSATVYRHGDLLHYKENP